MDLLEQEGLLPAKTTSGLTCCTDLALLSAQVNALHVHMPEVVFLWTTLTSATQQ